MDNIRFKDTIQEEDWLIILAAFILFLMFGMNWFFNNNDLVQKEPVRIHIREGMSFKEVVDSLSKYRLINSKTAFSFVGRFLGAEKKN